jgi:hypothetical protein
MLEVNRTSWILGATTGRRGYGKESWGIVRGVS